MSQIQVKTDLILEIFILINTKPTKIFISFCFAYKNTKNKLFEQIPHLLAFSCLETQSKINLVIFAILLFDTLTILNIDHTLVVKPKYCYEFVNFKDQRGPSTRVINIIC
jgi:hypothetical protein